MIVIISSILFTLFFALYFKWQNKDELDGTYNHNINDKKWHSYAFLMRFVFFIPLIYHSFFPLNFKDVVLSAFLCMPLYDIFINKFALNKEIFYSGSTSVWDKKLKNKKWFLYALGIIGSLLYYFLA